MNAVLAKAIHLIWFIRARAVDLDQSLAAARGARSTPPPPSPPPRLRRAPRAPRHGRPRRDAAPPPGGPRPRRRSALQHHKTLRAAGRAPSAARRTTAKAEIRSL